MSTITSRGNPLRPSPRKPRKKKIMPLDESLVQPIPKEPVQETMKAVEEAAPARKSKLEDFFDPNFIKLMQAAPNNSLVRGQIMKLTGVMPEPTLDTFIKLKDWIEINLEKLVKVDPKVKLPIVDQQPPVFELPVTISKTEYGTCNYSCRIQGPWTESAHLEDIRQWASEGATANEIISRMMETADADNNADMEEVDESLNITDRDRADSSDREVNLQNRRTAEIERLLRWVRSYDIDLLRTIEGNG
jgi:hypothetical protein